MAQGHDGVSRSKIAPWAHVLAVRDIDSSAKYFCEALGFVLEWPEATDWRLVRRDGVRVMLGKCPNATPAAEIGPHSWFAYAIPISGYALIRSQCIASLNLLLGEMRTSSTSAYFAPGFDV